MIRNIKVASAIERQSHRLRQAAHSALGSPLPGDAANPTPGLVLIVAAEIRRIVAFSVSAINIVPSGAIAMPLRMYIESSFKLSCAAVAAPPSPSDPAVPLPAIVAWPDLRSAPAPPPHRRIAAFARTEPPMRATQRHNAIRHLRSGKINRRKLRGFTTRRSRISRSTQRQRPRRNSLRDHNRHIGSRRRSSLVEEFCARTRGREYANAAAPITAATATTLIRRKSFSVPVPHLLSLRRPAQFRP